MDLREARKKAGLTQEQAAAIIGVHVSAVNQWEMGKMTPRVNKWQRIGETYGLTTNQVFSAVVESQMEAFDAGKRQAETPGE